MSGAVDRSGCKPFCGLSFNSLRDGQHEKELASWRENPGFCQSNGTHDSPIGCTAKCRDLALPPIAPVAGSASPVGVPLEPAAGQRWHETEVDYLFDVISVVGPNVHIRTTDGFPGQFKAHWFSRWKFLGPTPTPPATNPPPPAASLPALPSRQLVGAGARGMEKAGRAPGITCPHCLITSADGDQHTADCPRGDFSPRDAALTSEAWSAAVRLRLHEDEARKRALARPFVPSVTDEDLFGKAVR